MLDDDDGASCGSIRFVSFWFFSASIIHADIPGFSIVLGVHLIKIFGVNF